MAIQFWDIVRSDLQGSVQVPGQDVIYGPHPWDTVTIGDTPLPGICTVSGMPRLKVEQQKKNGADSVRFVASGYLPGPIDIQVLIWTPRQWDILQQAKADLWRLPNKKKSKADELAVSTSHPALWGISQVIIIGWGLPTPGPAPNQKIVKIECLEYVPNGRGDHTKVAKSASFERGKLIPALNKPEKPSDNPPGPNG